MKTRFGVREAIVAIALLAPASAFGAPITFQNFDTNPVTGPTQAPNTWYVDRYQPSGFSSQTFLGDNRLELKLSSDASLANRAPPYNSTFYNTQGRKYDTLGAQLISVDMFISSSFNGSNRVGGLWGSGANAGNVISSYPIIEFYNNQFQGWDGNIGWFALGLPSGFLLDQFHNLELVLDTANDKYLYKVDGQELGSVDAFGALQLVNGILQGYNDGTFETRSIYFDNFAADTGGETPLPAAAWLFGSVVAGGGLANWRRRRKQAAA